MWVLLALECATVVGCASEVAATDPNVATASGGEERPRRRRRRRRAVDATVNGAVVASPSAGGDSNASNATATSDGAVNSADRSAAVSEMGSPVVGTGSAASATRVEWTRDGDGGEAQCGTIVPTRHHRCPQCPREPENAGIVRAFVAVERNVIRCNPPTRPDGKLPVRVEFAHDGSAVAVRFPGVRLDDATALCLGRAVCAARVPNFQNPVATVSYEVHVLVPES